MLSRCGYDLIADGSLEGAPMSSWKYRLRAFFIRKVLGIDPELLLGGGNYFVVADKNRESHGGDHAPQSLIIFPNSRACATGLIYLDTVHDETGDPHGRIEQGIQPRSSCNQRTPAGFHYEDFPLA